MAATRCHLCPLGEVFVLEVTPGNILVSLYGLVQALLTPLCLDILEWSLDEAK